VQFPLDALTSAQIAGGRVETEVITGLDVPIVWASVIDNVTGDPIFVPAQ
jgi:hypothetical protein